MGRPEGCEAVCFNTAFFKNLLREHCFGGSYEGESVCTNFMDSVPQSGLEYTTCVINPCWVNEQRIKVLKCHWRALFLLTERLVHINLQSPSLWRGLFYGYCLFHSLFFLGPQSTGAPKSVLPESAGYIVKLAAHTWFPCFWTSLAELMSNPPTPLACILRMYWGNTLSPKTVVSPFIYLMEANLPYSLPNSNFHKSSKGGGGRNRYMLGSWINKIYLKWLPLISLITPMYNEHNLKIVVILFRRLCVKSLGSQKNMLNLAVDLT